MNNVLKQNWNKTVRPNDEIYILGDVTMKGSVYAAEILQQLNGRKYLIKGNHDRFVDQAGFDRSLFEWIRDYHMLNYQNQRFILFHYPIEEWNHSFRGSIHLHGHQHNNKSYNYQNLEKGKYRFDVGVDANDMYPVSIEEIITFFQKI